MEFSRGSKCHLRHEKQRNFNPQNRGHLKKKSRLALVRFEISHHRTKKTQLIPTVAFEVLAVVREPSDDVPVFLLSFMYKKHSGFNDSMIAITLIAIMT